MKDILVPISPGELLDKITILRIKVARIQEAGKLANVKLDFAMLEQTWRDCGGAGEKSRLPVRADRTGGRAAESRNGAALFHLPWRKHQGLRLRHRGGWQRGRLHCGHHIFCGFSGNCRCLSNH